MEDVQLTVLQTLLLTNPELDIKACYIGTRANEPEVTFDCALRFLLTGL